MELSTLILLALVAVVIFVFLGEVAPDVSPYKLIKQAGVSPTRNKGETAIYRHPATPKGTPLVAAIEPSLKTGQDVVEYGFKQNPNGDFLGARINDGPFVFQTYSQVYERVKNAGAGLLDKFGLKKGSAVGIFFKNSPEWIITDFACCFYGLISVPMYDTFDAFALTHIVKHTDISVVAVSEANADRILSIAGACSVLKHVIIVDTDKISSDLEQKAAAVKVKLHTLKQVEGFGKEKPRDIVKASPDDLYTICYTSGTTGTPKGVMLTHQNFAAALAGFWMLLPKDMQLCATDRHISYLPLSHMFERIIVVGMTYSGAAIGFFRGDILKLFDDILMLKPTVFPSVPRLLNRLFDKIKLGIDQSSPLKKAIFNLAYSQKLKLLRQGKVSNTTIWDKLVFKKVQAKLGGQLKYLITGSAPISHDVLDFLRVVLGCNVLEGYGQTETTASGTLSMWGDYQFPYGSHVGIPFGCCEIKLLDVPSMNYFAEDQPNPRGEICFRGPNVMKGYYKEPEKTKEILGEDGWLRTGDVGEFLPNGTLKIVDRVKNIFKLSQGEYIAPEKVEIKIKSKNFLQVFVHGDSLKSCLVAVIVPDPETALPWAKGQGIQVSNMTELCKNAKVNELFLQEINQLGKEGGLHKFELPKALYLHPEPFSVENGLLTPTFKLKRPQAKEMFLKEIDAMYAILKE